jgi:hypothetical protein
MALVLRLDMTFPISPQVSHEKSSKTTAYALPFCETPPADTTWLYPVLIWHIIPDQAQILNAPGGDNDNVGYYRLFGNIMLLSMDFLIKLALKSESRV